MSVPPEALEALAVQLENGLRMAGEDRPQYVIDAIEGLRLAALRWAKELKQETVNAR